MKFHRFFQLLLILSFGFCAVSMGAETSVKKHRVVFEIVSEGQEPWYALLNNVENARKAFGADTIEIKVVAHGKGLSILLKDSAVGERIAHLAGLGVVFAACENSMKKKGVTKEQLLPFAITVDSGVAEVIRSQEAGWAYLKSGG